MSSRRRTLGTGSPDDLRNLRPEAAEYRRAVLVAREALATARTPDAHRAAVSALEAAEVGFALQLRAAERRRHARVAERGLEPSFGRAPPTRGGAEDEGEGGGEGGVTPASPAGGASERRQRAREARGGPLLLAVIAMGTRRAGDSR